MISFVLKKKKEYVQMQMQKHVNAEEMTREPHVIYMTEVTF